MKLLFLVLCVCSASFAPKGQRKHQGKCNYKDKIIYKRIGHEFAHKFRAFGGLRVYKPEYEEAVRKATKLSVPCSECYGDAYICGYDKCFWSCSTEGQSCNECLEKEGCISECNKCTGL